MSVTVFDWRLQTVRIQTHMGTTLVEEGEQPLVPSEPSAMFVGGFAEPLYHPIDCARPTLQTI